MKPKKNARERKPWRKLLAKRAGGLSKYQGNAPVLEQFILLWKHTGFPDRARVWFCLKGMKTVRSLALASRYMFHCSFQRILHWPHLLHVTSTVASTVTLAMWKSSKRVRNNKAASGLKLFAPSNGYSNLCISWLVCLDKCGYSGNLQTRLGRRSRHSFLFGTHEIKIAFFIQFIHLFQMPVKSIFNQCGFLLELPNGLSSKPASKQTNRQPSRPETKPTGKQTDRQPTGKQTKCSGTGWTS